MINYHEQHIFLIWQPSIYNQRLFSESLAIRANAIPAPGVNLIKYGQTLKNIFSLAAIALLLSACGGGDSTPASPLARYAGTWTFPCDNHIKNTDIYTVTPGTSDSVTVAYKQEIYDKQDCTGTLLATITLNANTTLTLVSSVDASVALAPAMASTLISVDKFNLFMGKGTVNVIGPGVNVETINGVRYWVIPYNDSEKVYVADSGEIAPYTDSGYSYVNGNTLYFLKSSGTTFEVEGTASKVR